MIFEEKLKGPKEFNQAIFNAEGALKYYEMVKFALESLAEGEEVMDFSIVSGKKLPGGFPEWDPIVHAFQTNEVWDIYEVTPRQLLKYLEDYAIGRQPPEYSVNTAKAGR